MARRWPKVKTYHEHLEEFKEKASGCHDDHHPLALKERPALLDVEMLLDRLAMLDHLSVRLVFLDRTVPFHPLDKALVGVFRAGNQMISIVRMQTGLHVLCENGDKCDVVEEVEIEGVSAKGVPLVPEKVDDDDDNDDVT